MLGSNANGQRRAAQTLRECLQSAKMLLVPGASDVITARLVAQSGFDAVYMTGLGATATRIGMPDLGLMTQTEMADQARNMCRAVDIPVVADADTGYGGPLNIRRAVADYVQAGVGALHLEDQVSPKRCGQLAGIRIVPETEAEARLRAAIDARAEYGDIVIIARTDALPGHGMDVAIERVKRYADTGVDLVFIDGVKTQADVEAIAGRIDAPCVVSIVDGTDAAKLDAATLEQMGFRMCLYAVTSLFAALGAQTAALEQLREEGRLRESDYSYQRFCDLIGLAAHQTFAHRHETGAA